MTRLAATRFMPSEPALVDMRNSRALESRHGTNENKVHANCASEWGGREPRIILVVERLSALPPLFGTGLTIHAEIVQTAEPQTVFELAARFLRDALAVHLFQTALYEIQRKYALAKYQSAIGQKKDYTTREGLYVYNFIILRNPNSIRIAGLEVRGGHHSRGRRCLFIWPI